MEAIRIAGDVPALADVMGMPMNYLAIWMKGKDPVPDWAFLKLTDYVNDKSEDPPRSI